MVSRRRGHRVHLLPDRTYPSSEWSRRPATGRVASLVAVGFVLLTDMGCNRDSSKGAPDVSQASPTSRENVAPVVGFGPGGVELDYEARYVGSDACGECHVEHHDHARTSHMANTSARVTVDTRDRWFSPRRLADPMSWPPSEGTPSPRYRRDSFLSDS